MPTPHHHISHAKHTLATVLHPTAQCHLFYSYVPHCGSSKPGLRATPRQAALKLRTKGYPEGKCLIRKASDHMELDKTNLPFQMALPCGILVQEFFLSCAAMNCYRPAKRGS